MFTGITLKSFVINLIFVLTYFCSLWYYIGFPLKVFSFIWIMLNTLHNFFRYSKYFMITFTSHFNLKYIVICNVQLVYTIHLSIEEQRPTSVLYWHYWFTRLITRGKNRIVYDAAIFLNIWLRFCAYSVVVRGRRALALCINIYVQRNFISIISYNNYL